MRATTLTYAAAPIGVNTEALGTALRYARNVALFLLAPFIGLVYAVAFPFVGIGVLAWLAVRAVFARRAAA